MPTFLPAAEKKKASWVSMGFYVGGGVCVKWSVEMPEGYGRSLLVVCPRCGRVGRLYYSVGIGWYVKHGSRSTHKVRGDDVLEVPLHEPRLNLVKYMGGDSFLLPYLAKMIPPHECYVEVFGGGAPLLLNKPPSRVEVYNDLDGLLVNLFKVVRERYDEFMEKARWLLYSRQLYYEYLHALASNKISDPVERAVAFWYVLSASYAGAAGIGSGFGTSTKHNEARAMWARLGKLELIHKRLRNVVIEQLDFREVLKKYDGDRTFFYLDPPHLYIATEKKDAMYRLGFTEKDYMDLLGLLEKARGKWLLKQTAVTPWLLEWAEGRGYSYTTVTLKKALRPDPRMQRADTYKVLFIANYPLRRRNSRERGEKK